MFSFGRMGMPILSISQVEEEDVRVEEIVIMVEGTGSGIVAEVVVKVIVLVQIKVLLSRANLVTSISLQPPSQIGRCKV